jgi:hypothetical protein
MHSTKGQIPDILIVTLATMRTLNLTQTECVWGYCGLSNVWAECIRTLEMLEKSR